MTLKEIWDELWYLVFPELREREEELEEEEERLAEERRQVEEEKLQVQRERLEVETERLELEREKVKEQEQFRERDEETIVAPEPEPRKPMLPPEENKLKQLQELQRRRGGPIPV